MIWWFFWRISLIADIDEMIRYVLKEGDNAASDTFYFSFEDSGKTKMLYYAYLRTTPSGRYFFK